MPSIAPRELEVPGPGASSQAVHVDRGSAGNSKDAQWVVLRNE